MGAADEELLVRCGTRVVEPEDVLGPRVSPGGSKGDTPGSVIAGRAHGTESSGVHAWSESARPRGWSGMSGWQAQSESAHEGWGPEGLVFPRAARGRVRLRARWIASRQSRWTVLRSSPTEEVVLTCKTRGRRSHADTVGT